MKTFNVTIQMQVADSWVADGFDLQERKEDIVEMFAAMLPYAYEHEVKVNVKFGKCPTGEQLSDLREGITEIKD